MIKKVIPFSMGLVLVLAAVFILMTTGTIPSPYKCRPNMGEARMTGGRVHGDTGACYSIFTKSFWKSSWDITWRKTGNIFLEYPIVQAIHPIYAADFSNDAVLVGASHNIFVGKVVRMSGDKNRGTGPETQFEVEVIENIKGNLSGTIIVNQQGGYADGTLYIVESEDALFQINDEYLLKEGSTYLLATRFNELENWHTLNSYPTARKLLSEDKDLDLSDLKSIATADNRVAQLKASYPNESLLKADEISGNARNSYKSQSQEDVESETSKNDSPSIEAQDAESNAPAENVSPAEEQVPEETAAELSVSVTGE